MPLLQSSNQPTKPRTRLRFRFLYLDPTLRLVLASVYGLPIVLLVFNLFVCPIAVLAPLPLLPLLPLISAVIVNVLRAWSQRFSQIRSPHPPALEPRFGPRSSLFNTFVLHSSIESILNVHRSPPALLQVKEPGLVFDGVGTTPPEGGDRGIASLLELWKL